jgi:uncharacterized protein (DUF1015 family)
MVGLVLWRALPFLGPVPPGGLYNSDSAVPVLMSNLATGAPVDWLFWGQDRFGSWPFLLARAAGALADRAWTPHGMHVLRTLWMVAAVVPWLALAGRAGAVAAAGLLLLPGLNPLLERVLVDLGTVDGWQVPVLLWAWWGLRRAQAGRDRAWARVALVAGALATWTSLVSAPLLVVLGLVEEEEWARSRPARALLLPHSPGAGEAGVRHPGTARCGPRLARREDAGVAGRGPSPGERGTGGRDRVARGGSPWLLVALVAAAVALAVGRWRAVPEGRTVAGAGAAALAALLVVVAVRHVRDNGYNPRYLCLGLSLAVLGTSVLLGLVVHALVSRVAPGAAPVGLGMAGLAAVLLLAPIAEPDPREVVLRPAVAEIAAHHPGAVLALSCWRTYAAAGLLRRARWCRPRDEVEPAPELGSGAPERRPVLVGSPDAAGVAPPGAAGAGRTLDAGPAGSLSAVSGESTGNGCRSTGWRRTALRHCPTRAPGPCYKRDGPPMRPRPLRALRPPPSWPPPSPPRRTTSSARPRRALADGNPRLLPHQPARVDLPEHVDEHSDRCARGRHALDEFRRNGWLLLDDAPRFSLYRQRMGAQVQTGLVACASVEAYNRGDIKRHELTRPDKEDDRTRHIETLEANDEPVFLAYRARPSVDAVLRRGAERTPELSFTSDDGVEHTVWVLPPAESAAIEAALSELDTLYIADGHHRSAAAARVQALRRSGGQGGGEWDWFLAVVFSHQSLQILPYHRLVKDLGPGGSAALLEGLRARFEVTPAARPEPEGPHGFGLYLGGRWWRLVARPEAIPAAAHGALDVSILQEAVLAPLLGIHDPRRDPRIEFVGGIRGTAELQARVDRGEARAAFALWPTSMRELLEISDAGRSCRQVHLVRAEAAVGLFLHPF